MPNPNIVDYLNPRIWTGVVRDTPFPVNYIGNQFFPSRNVPGDRIEWDYIYEESPLAPFVAVGDESPKLDKSQKFRKGWADVTYVRYKAELRAEDVRWLRNFGDAPENTQAGAMAARARDEITRLANTLSNSVDGRIEWMQINSLLGSMAVAPTLPENVGKSNIKFTLTYPVRTVTASPLWSDTVNAKPFTDMRTWFQALETWEPAVAIMSRDVMWYLVQNESIRRQLFLARTGQSGDIPDLVGNQSIVNWFSAELGLRVIVYDARYSTRTYGSNGEFDIVRRRFLPNNKVIFLPNGPMGYTATVPAEQNNWAYGKFAWTSTPDESGRKDPWVYELGAGFYGLPVIERPDQVLVATVAA